MSDTPVFDHHDPAYVTHHRVTHTALRKLGSVVYTTAHGGYWVLTDYRSVSEVARDDRRFSSALSLLIPPGNVERLIPLQSDPPDLHTYRLALMPLFTREAVESMRPTIAADARACIADMLDNREAEVIEDLALPVPGRTTMRLQGLSAARWEEFARPIKAATFAHPDSPEYHEAELQIQHFTQALADEVDSRWRQAPEDGIGSLISFRHTGRRFNRREVIDLVRMLIFGGMDTVTGAIGNIVARLATQPALQAKLRNDYTLIPTAIEEFLRFDPPIPGFARRTTCPVSLSGEQIPQGETLWLNWTAANHDPQQFLNPNRIDLTRKPNRHLAFGVGGHLCLGARLARAELEEVLSALIEATDDIVLASPGIVEPRTIGQLNGKAAVHVQLKKRNAAHG